MIALTRARRCDDDQRCDYQERYVGEERDPTRGPLCGFSVVLRASVVNFRLKTFTTETQGATEITQRNTFEFNKQNPVAFSCAEATGWRRDLFRKREFRLRPEHPCARRSKAATAFRQVSWLRSSLAIADDLHSGATARDSHPLPYYSRSNAGHPNAFERPGNASVPANVRARYHGRKRKSKLIALPRVSASSNIHAQ